MKTIEPVLSSMQTTEKAQSLEEAGQDDDEQVSDAQRTPSEPLEVLEQLQHDAEQMLQENEGSALIDHQETAKSLQVNKANDADRPSQVVGELD